ncbi:MAG: DUF2207 domain-containing protein [Ruminococcaceae bacterium]|nr:DUF2207 domain-containing protein [Oscillospiraceae bacterium]
MRQIWSVFVVLALMFALMLSASAAAAEVTSLDTQIVVDEDGSCRVTMTATVQFLSTARRFTMPLATDADDINASGGSYDTDELDGVECVIFESKHGFSGSKSFICSFTVPYAVRDTQTGQVFTMKLPERGWDYPIVSYAVQIEFPMPITQRPTWDSAYFGIDIENYLDIQVEENTMLIRSFDRLNDKETIRMDLAFEGATFSLRHRPGQTSGVATVLFWILFAAALLYRHLRLRNRRMPPSVRQTPMNDSTAGEIPCQLFAQLPDAMGIFAHWGNLGYLTILRNRNGRVQLKKKMEMGSERPAAERKLFYTIFKVSDTIDAVEPRVLKITARVGAQLRNTWTRNMFRKSTGSPYMLRLLALAAAGIMSMMTFDLLLPANLLRWFLLPFLMAIGVVLSFALHLATANFYARRQRLFLLIGAVCALLLLILAGNAGCFLLMLASIALQIYCAAGTMFGGVRERNAQDLVCQILGLRTFLRHAETKSLNRLCEADGQYFYRMLPFAEQLGVAPAFARCCKHLQLEPCPWLIDSLSKQRDSLEFYDSYAQIAAVIRKEPSVRQMIKMKHSEAVHG